MDAVISTIIEGLTSGAAGFLYAFGWMLFLLERYYISPKKDASHREDLAAARAEIQAISERTGETLSRFATLLEVIKDRLGRD